jgi:hypothetical protein
VITIFDLTRWRKLQPNPDQLTVFGHIEFEAVIAHPNLYVADVTKEECVMLVLLGCDIDHTIAASPKEIEEAKTRMIYKGADGAGYTIMNIYHATIPFDE